MKKILYFVAAFATLAFTSCQKDKEADIQAPAQTLNLDLSVAGLGDQAADNGTAKVAKQAWANGDKINIFFDNTAISSVREPDLIITYNGTTWTAGTLRAGITLKNNGYLSCFYEGYNDLSQYGAWFDGGIWYYHRNRTYINDAEDRVDANPLIARREMISYAYNSETNTLSAEIALQFFTRFKVLIPTDAEFNNTNAYEWFLQVKNITQDRYPSVLINGIRAGVTYPEMFNGSANYNGFAAGVQESDGIAFYYNSFPNTAGDEIQFNLRHNANGTVKSYNKTLVSAVETSANKCVGVQIAYNKFN